MRSLFLKIFIWFGLAMAIVISANFLSSYVTFREDTRGRPPGNFTTMFAQTAVEKLEREGTSGANNYLDALEKTTLTRSYLFDQNGNEITGRNAPPEAIEAASRARDEREVRPSGNSQLEYIVSRVIPSGECQTAETAISAFLASQLVGAIDGCANNSRTALLLAGPLHKLSCCQIASSNATTRKRRPYSPRGRGAAKTARRGG
jgi:hypothetical protein